MIELLRRVERLFTPTGRASYSLNHWVGLGRYLLDGDVPPQTGS